MRSKVSAILLLFATTSPTFGQGVAFFQDEVTELPGGSLWDGTVDNEFRAANPTTEQSENVNLSIDQFDGGFQTQGAIRFENLLVSDGGLVPDGLTAEGNGILFAELRVWKQSPSQSDANIDFNRIIGKDTTSGDYWGNDDTWASLGGDLIPDEFGLLDGDPIARDGVEAASIPDFQDKADRFAPDETVVLNPNDGPVASNLVYRTDQDSEDVFDEAWDGTPEDLDRAIDVAFWRFDVTDAVREWLYDADPNTEGTQPALENFGWSISNDTGDGWDMRSSEVIDFFEDEFSDEDTKIFRPALTIIFDDGSAGPLDLDKSGDIDLADYDEFLDLIGSHLDAPLTTGSPGDFDFDRDVDLDDFKHFKNEYPGGPDGLAAALAGVPEPGAGVLAVLALCGVAVRRRWQTVVRS